MTRASAGIDRPVARAIGAAALVAALALESHGAWAAPAVGPRPAESRVAIVVAHDKTLVPVRFDGARELHLILDTGMGYDGVLLFRPGLKDSIGMRHPIAAKIGGAGGGPPSEALFSDSMSFRIGDAGFENQRVIVLAGGAMATGTADGVIGYSVLGHYAVAIDFDSLTLTLHEPQGFTPAPGWTSLALEFGKNDLPFVTTSIVVRDEPPVSLRSYIDCASSETIELLLRPGMKFTLPKRTEDADLGRGLSGDIRGKRGVISRLILGPYALRQVRAAFVPAEIRSKAGSADAVLANAALRRFNLVFDYAHSRLLIRPNRHFGDPFR